MKKIVTQIILALFLMLHNAKAENIEKDAHVLITNLVEAYNSRDIKALEGLIGNTNLTYLVERSRENICNIDIDVLSVSIAEETNVKVKVAEKTLAGNPSRLYNAIISLDRYNEKMRLINIMRVPDDERKIQEFRDANEAGIRLMVAINRGDTNTILRLVGVAEKDMAKAEMSRVLQQRDLAWIKNVMDKSLTIKHMRIDRRKGEPLQVEFLVTGDGVPQNMVKEMIFTNGFFGNINKKSEIPSKKTEKKTMSDNERRVE